MTNGIVDSGPDNVDFDPDGVDFDPDDVEFDLDNVDFDPNDNAFCDPQDETLDHNYAIVILKCRF